VPATGAATGLGFAAEELDAEGFEHFVFSGNAC